MRMFFHLFVARHEECSLIGFLTTLNRMINRKIRIDNKKLFMNEKFRSLKSNGCYDQAILENNLQYTNNAILIHYYYYNT